MNEGVCDFVWGEDMVGWQGAVHVEAAPRPLLGTLHHDGLHQQHTFSECRSSKGGPRRAPSWLLSFLQRPLQPSAITNQPAAHLQRAQVLIG